MGFPDQADKLVMVNQPDAVVVDKRWKKAVVLNVAIPSDSKIRNKGH